MYGALFNCHPLTCRAVSKGGQRCRLDGHSRAQSAAERRLDGHGRASAANACMMVLEVFTAHDILYKIYAGTPARGGQRCRA